MKKLNSIFQLFFICILLFGCVREERVLRVSPGTSPAKLALLPVNNLTNDVQGAQMFRDLLYKRLKEHSKGYELMEVEAIDKILNGSGITDGGQLSVARPIELCELLGVDGLLYTDIENLDLLTLPFYHIRRVKAQFRLYSFEKLIWLKSINTSNRYIEVENILKTIDDPEAGLKMAGESMLVHQGIKFSTIALFGHELRPEMEMTLDKFLLQLPWGSSQNSPYLEKASARLEKLHKAVAEKIPIVTEDMYFQEKEVRKIYDDGITIIN
jgi:hypothetical protein